MIVLNGEPFTRYCLRSVYPFAHQIIVVEGAAPAARCVATPNGHSRDGTLDAIREFQKHEDPDNKVILVTAEDDGHPDGFWPGEKHEQSQAYARRTTGNYLWQVDCDEFYQPEDMQNVMTMLRQDPTISAVSFKQITFWGGFDYWCDSWYLQRGATIYHRLFKWGVGYRYTTHRPPTVIDPQGCDQRDLHWVGGEELAGRGIRLYHLSLLLPDQVRDKCDYYGSADWARKPGAPQWAHDVFTELRRPFRVHNVYEYPSWLEQFTGKLPPQVEALRAALESGQLGFPMRRTDDIERLLRSPVYRLGRAALKFWEPHARRRKESVGQWLMRLVRTTWSRRRKSMPQTPGMSVHPTS